MRAHCADRISVGGSPLNLKALDWVCIVRAPDLRTVEKHACVKAAADRITVHHSRHSVAAIIAELEKELRGL